VNCKICFVMSKRSSILVLQLYLPIVVSSSVRNGPLMCGESSYKNGKLIITQLVELVLIKVLNLLLVAISSFNVMIVVLYGCHL